jgi:hypothetical protein
MATAYNLLIEQDILPAIPGRCKPTISRRPVYAEDFETNRMPGAGTAGGASV